MRNKFDMQLECLHNEMIKMGSLCEEAISLAIKALTENDKSLIDSVYTTDDEIDRKESEIETLCMKLLLMQQPVAGDLRKISSALKMISDMERIGDQASDIAEISEYILTSSNKGIMISDLKTMAEEAVKMVTMSIDSFVKHDVALAEKVINYDDIIDNWFMKLKGELIKKIQNDGENSEFYVDLLMITKYLERIGDHATNIAEWVEYAVTGVHKKS